MSSANANPAFTCISCAIMFVSAEEQRLHYKGDLHRYNMKRRVAGLPPINSQSFDAKLLERQPEQKTMAGLRCEACRKSFSTENSFKSHQSSKKHLEAMISRLSAPSGESRTYKESSNATPAKETSSLDEGAPTTDGEPSKPTLTGLECLFCPTRSDEVDSNVRHMGRQHGLFIPDQEYLVDLPGLLKYLGGKVYEHHVCLWCNGKGKEWRSAASVQQHMSDKAHCKIAYDTQNERLEVSDYYDFRPSYGTDAPKGDSARLRPNVIRVEEVKDEDEWADDDDVDEDEADEIVEDSEEEDLDADAAEVSYGDSPFELVLPSGARVGHRSLRKYYAQKFANPLPNQAKIVNSEMAIQKRLNTDRNGLIIPAAGGDFGGAGRGMMTIKVDTLGEAKEAGRHIREFRDHHKRDLYRTKIGLKSNNKKNFRDQLLQ